jgi:archaellum biogenesis protein FlaJ (TadC family)
MKINDPSNPQDLTTLTKQRDIFKSLLISFCILWPCILVAAIYFYHKKENIALFIPVVTIVLGLLPVYLRFKTLNAEIRSRN